MTNGIIQKVFSNYEPLSPLLKLIRQELIEEIKKWDKTTTWGNITELIGDNK